MMLSMQHILRTITRKIPILPKDKIIGVWKDFFLFLKQEGEDTGVVFAFDLSEFVATGKCEPQKLSGPVYYDFDALSADSLFAGVLENTDPVLYRLDLSIESDGDRKWLVAKKKILPPNNPLPQDVRCKIQEQDTRIRGKYLKQV